MGLGHSPRIVTSGLALCLDAANIKSYPGSGTTWYDVSGNGRHGTIIPRVAGYTFNDSYFNFPASGTEYGHGYVTSTIPTGAISWTVETLVRASNIDGERHIFRTPGNFGCDLTPTNRLRYYMTDFTVETGFTGANTFFPNEWFLLTMTYDRTAMIQSIYKNGVFISSKSHTVQYSIGTATNLWFARSDLFQDGLGGDAALVKFYTKTLTPTEILQNFYAIRGRFKI